MTPADTARVLTRIAGVDQRTIGKADVAAWHETIGHFDLEDCLEAVRQFFASEAERRIKPADIVSKVKAIHSTRLNRALEPAPDNPDDPDAYIRQIRATRRRIAEPAPPGTPAITSPHRRGGPPPEGLRAQLAAARAACAQASAQRRGGDDGGGLTDTERAARERARAEKAKRTRTGAMNKISAQDMRNTADKIRRAEEET